MCSCTGRLNGGGAYRTSSDCQLPAALFATTLLDLSVTAQVDRSREKLTVVTRLFETVSKTWTDDEASPDAD